MGNYYLGGFPFNTILSLSFLFSRFFYSKSVIGVHADVLQIPNVLR